MCLIPLKMWSELLASVPLDAGVSSVQEFLSVKPPSLALGIPDTQIILGLSPDRSRNLSGCRSI